MTSQSSNSSTEKLIAIEQMTYESWQAELAALQKENNQLWGELAIAMQQAQIYQQIEQANATLTATLEQHKVQLRQALDFEFLLKRITDQVRDSLDQVQTLQMVVQELALGLNLYGCSIGLYDLEQQTSTVCYKHIRAATQALSAQAPSVQASSVQAHVRSLSEDADIYRQLLGGQPLQFSWLPEAAPQYLLAQPYTILICPIISAENAIGELWLYKASDAVFEEAEVRLGQQVANQCAIALRQAQLYQISQIQNQERQRLDQLKDDFLDSVSHELRTPLANIRMASQMLQILLQPTSHAAEQVGSIKQYLHVLQSECQKEMNLIDDLLELSYLTANVEPLTLSTIDISVWMHHWLEPFATEAQRQHQLLQVNVPSQLLQITTDLSYLERVLTELLRNACKYTPAGEKIRVAATAMSETLQISISNSGVNIPDLELAHIFDKFHRVPGQEPWRYGGTGIGLALVKKRVEQIQGTIAVASSEGWNTFTLQLPQSIQPRASVQN
ncbi:MAG: hypothetical protein Kow00121_29220 [Elainellaceae cyanobacterium]